MASPLITPEQMRELLDLSEYTDSAGLVKALRETEQMELKNFLSPEMYYDLLSNRTATKYVNLLNGCNYTGPWNETIEFRGLKAMLTYYAYARHASRGGAQDTESGITRKKNEYADAADPKILSGIAADYRNMGQQAETEARTYIIQNQTDFPLFNDFRTIHHSGGFSIGKAGKWGRNTKQHNHDNDQCHCGRYRCTIHV